MSGRLLPENEHIEETVRDRVIGQLAADGQHVVQATRCDTEDVPFDWLLQMADGTCIALEVVRAEDESQIRHVEAEHRAGESVIVGSAEMPWDSFRTAIDKKLRKADGYRNALTNLCSEGQVHLAITSGLQQLHFDGDIGEHIEELARNALSAFDAVWLVEGTVARRIV